MEEDIKTIEVKLEDIQEDYYEDPLAPRSSDYEFIIEHCNQKRYAEIKFGNNEFCCKSLSKKEDVNLLNCNIKVEENCPVNSSESTSVVCKSEIDDLKQLFDNDIKEEIEPESLTLLSCRFCSFQSASRQEVYKHELAECCFKNLSKKEDVNLMNCNIKVKENCPVNSSESTSIVCKSEIDDLKQLFDDDIKEEIEPESLTLLSCRLCSFQSASKQKVYEHELAGHESSEIKFFKSKSHLVNESNGLIKRMYPLSCTYCDYQTDLTVDLEIHGEMFHRDVLAFTCHKCDYKTIYKYIFDKHKRFHATVIPYSCGFCFYKCKSFVCLKRHVNRLHSHLKPFVCFYCHYRANTSFAIGNHLETKHSNYLTNGKLKNYLIKKTLTFRERYTYTVSEIPVQPFSCKYCKLTFAEKSSFYHHLRNDHKDQVRIDSSNQVLTKF